MLENIFSFEASLWLYSSSKSSWYFVSLPSLISQEIKSNFGYLQQGWGSIKVKVTVEDCFWETSIFPDKKQSAYILPIKSAIRKKLKAQENSKLSITLEIKYAL